MGGTPWMRDALAFYASPGPLTAVETPGLEDLRVDAPGVLRVVRGLALHEAFAALYGVEVPSERRGLEHLRPAQTLLDRVRELDPGPLHKARPPARRLATYCRHLAVLTISLLRQVGVPARARSGFAPGVAPYFAPGRFLDHWWVEYWQEDSGRWVIVDPGLDAEVLPLPFDPNDVPAGRYLCGAEVWKLCRAGRVDPSTFGVGEFWGAWFVRNNVVRDLAALNKVELLPWDYWGLMDHEAPLGGGRADSLVDRVAEAVVADDWPLVCRLYARAPLLQVPVNLLAEPMGAYPDWTGT